MKKTAILCSLCLILALAGCGKDEKQNPAPAPDVLNAEENLETGIENGGDIIEDETVNIETEEAQEDNKKPETPNENNQGGIETGFVENAVRLEFDENGNITKQCAVNILQLYTAEQLGLTPDVSHKLLFDPSVSEVGGKPCHVIVAKIPDGETEGVFYVALDGQSAYKYDLENQQYIKLP